MTLAEYDLVVIEAGNPQGRQFLGIAYLHCEHARRELDGEPVAVK